MRSTFSKRFRLLASLALVSLARADYYIDDQNYTSLLYSQNPGGAIWGPFNEGHIIAIPLANGTMMPVDATQCFNYTYTYAACTVANNCQVQIPFTGSGITIYVLQAGAQGINASLTIDGGAPKYNVLPAPPGPNFYTPSVTLFSIQGMTTGNHTATMTVQNWNNIFSGMMFDYAVINQTVVSTTTTSSPIVSSTALSTTLIPTSTETSSPSKSTTNVGAIVGGVVGGLAALVALLLALFYLRRRHSEAPRFGANLEAEPRIEPVSADSLHHQELQRQTVVTAVPTTEGLVTGTVSAHALPHSTSSGSLSSSPRGKSQSGTTNLSMSQIASSDVTSPAQAGGLSSAYSPSESSRPRIQQTHPMLTDDQVDFVNNLYANNVPAAVIARVIERMMAGERQPAVDGYDSLPPPSYYHGTGDK
ncbi:hypothetical protein OG21DRAFT_1511006 [Imleria badia]|nr:hypothetical protein OG21DRAFT_1511006 [Imleria badia]